MIYRALVFLHVVAGFVFMMGHGASAAMMFRIKSEKKMSRVQALLETTQRAQVVTYPALLIMILAGIAAGVMGSWWSKGWIWLSCGLLIAITMAMGWLGRGFVDPIIKAAGLPYNEGFKTVPGKEPAGEDEIRPMLKTGRPVLLSVIGLIGWGLILWLMMFKPF
jgi:hypothetical protein